MEARHRKNDHKGSDLQFLYIIKQLFMKLEMSLDTGTITVYDPSVLIPSLRLTPYSFPSKT